MSFEIGAVAFAGFCSGPPSPNSQEPIQKAIQLSMIVEITSCAPTVAFRKPAIPAQRAPAEGRRADREQDVRQRSHPLKAVADPVGHVEAYEVLALTSNVEHPAAERERDCEARRGTAWSSAGASATGCTRRD